MTERRSRNLGIALVVAGLTVGGCMATPRASTPSSFEAALAAARASMQMQSPVEVLRREEGGQVYVLYLGDAVRDGVGLAILDAAEPWPTRFIGTGTVLNANFGGVGLAMSGNEDGTSQLYVFGIVRDSRVDRVLLDLGPDGTVEVPAGVPGFAEVLEFDHEVRFPPLEWRFVGRDGSSVYSPYD